MTRTLPHPLRFAFSSVSSSARSFTSAAHTVASGEANASERAIGPQPHPRSSRLPCSGGSGACLSNTDVPRSRRDPENTPFDTSTSVSRPRNCTCRVRRTSFDEGSAEKYCSAMMCPEPFRFLRLSSVPRSLFSEVRFPRSASRGLLPEVCSRKLLPEVAPGGCSPKRLRMFGQCPCPPAPPGRTLGAKWTVAGLSPHMMIIMNVPARFVWRRRG